VVVSVRYSRRTLGIALVALVVLAAGVGAYTVVFTAGQGGTYEADSGLEVTSGIDHGISDINPFLDTETIYLSDVYFNSSADTSLTVDQFTGTTTDLSSIDATNGSIEINPGDKRAVTVDGAVTDVLWSSLAYDGTGSLTYTSTGTGTITVEAPANTPIMVTDSNNQLVTLADTGSAGDVTVDVGSETRTLKFYANSGPVGNGSVFEPGSGLAVTLNETTTLNDVSPSTVYPFSNTVYLDTSDGTIEFVASGGATGTIAASDISGTWTTVTGIDASSTTLQIDPGDKPQVAVNGAATRVEIADYALDDGTNDLVIEGPDGTSSDVTFYGLPADTTVTAVNATRGTALDVATTDSNGQVTFDIGHSKQTIELQSGDQSSTPTQDNAAPTGELSQEPEELSVDVGDADFPDDNVSVTFSLDGSELTQEYIESNSTVTATIPSSGKTGGQHNWTVNATDSLGNTNEQIYNYSVPDTLTVRNETNASQIITGVNITAIFYSADGTTVVQKTDEDDDGNISLQGLPAGKEFVVTVEADDYYDRRTYLASLYEQSNIYVLNSTEYDRDAGDAIQTNFQLEDRSGNFPEGETILRVKRAVDIDNDGNYTVETVAGDYWGAAGEFPFIGQYQARYIITIENADGDVRDKGPFIPTEDGFKTITIGEIRFEGENGTGQFFDAQLTQDDQRLEAVYNDGTNSTDDLTIAVYERNNKSNEIFNQSYADGQGRVTIGIDLTENQSEMDWVVEYNGVRNGEAIKGQRYTGGSPFDVDINQLWLTILGGGFITIVGSMYGPRTAQLGAISMVLLAMMFTYLNILVIATPLIVAAAVIAVGGVIYNQGRPSV